MRACTSEISTMLLINYNKIFKNNKTAPTTLSQDPLHPSESSWALNSHESQTIPPCGMSAPFQEMPVSIQHVSPKLQGSPDTESPIHV